MVSFLASIVQITREKRLGMISQRLLQFSLSH